MTKRRYPETVLCGLCTHQVNDHNQINGCELCDCMATQGEANTERPGHVAAPVHYDRKPILQVEPARDVAARALWISQYHHLDGWDHPNNAEFKRRCYNWADVVIAALAGAPAPKSPIVHELRFHRCPSHDTWSEVRVDGGPWTKLPSPYAPFDPNPPVCSTPDVGDVAGTARSSTWRTL